MELVSTLLFDSPESSVRPAVTKSTANDRARVPGWRWPLFAPFLAVLLVLELLACAVIILKVKYTEIDWIAYMQEVEGWLIRGDSNYMNLRGDTGPLVYPAVFMYVYAALRALSRAYTASSGQGVLVFLHQFWASLRGQDGLLQEATPTDVVVIQWTFALLSVATLALVLCIYWKAKPGPPAIVLLLLLSKRMHSLFVLRLFNDCVAMMVTYAAVLLFTLQHWSWGCILLSTSIGIKMNSLLFLPGLLWLMARNAGMWAAIGNVGLMLLVQVAAGAPFLSTYPQEYLARAFELSRVFMYKWTVNLKFLPEDLFVSKSTATLLLVLHLAALVALASARWGSIDDGVFGTIQRVVAAGFGCKAPSPALRGAARAEQPSQLSRRTLYRDTPLYIAFVLFSSNFAGIVFARTLHYQFYTWYFHSLPLLLWCTDLHVVLKVAIMAGIEYAFNVGDADGAGTPLSSAILTSAHLLTLAALVFSDWQPRQRPTLVDDEEATARPHAE